MIQRLHRVDVPLAQRIHRWRREHQVVGVRTVLEDPQGMPQFMGRRDSQAPGEVWIIRRNQRVDVDVQWNPELEPGSDRVS
jgi:hypothetical protein